MRRSVATVSPCRALTSVALVGIGHQVVELLAAARAAHQLEAVGHQRVLAAAVPAGPFAAGSLRERPAAPSAARQRVLALGLRQETAARLAVESRQDGGHHVDHRHHALDPHRRSHHAGRKADDQRHPQVVVGDAAVRQPVVLAERLAVVGGDRDDRAVEQRGGAALDQTADLAIRDRDVGVVAVEHAAHGIAIRDRRRLVAHAAARRRKRRSAGGANSRPRRSGSMPRWSITESSPASLSNVFSHVGRDAVGLVRVPEMDPQQERLGRPLLEPGDRRVRGRRSLHLVAGGSSKTSKPAPMPVTRLTGAALTNAAVV